MRRTLLLIALLFAPALHAGTVLRGGSFATIEWSAATLPANAEEWEAFLSLDGGTYYAFRITPHLDIARRQFTWLVPNIDTKNARILIRTGDERRETLHELPARFEIVRDVRAEVPRRTIVPAAQGEAARSGDPGVVAWTDGDRTGGALVQRTALPERAQVAASRATSSRTDVVIAPGGFLVLSSWLLGAHRKLTTKNQELTTKNLQPVDILSRSSRLNI
jgi:hypothetical protein